MEFFQKGILCYHFWGLLRCRFHMPRVVGVLLGHQGSTRVDEADRDDAEVEEEGGKQDAAGVRIVGDYDEKACREPRRGRGQDEKVYGPDRVLLGRRRPLAYYLRGVAGGIGEYSRDVMIC